MKTKETIQRKILGGLTDEYVAGWLISNRCKNQSIVVILKEIYLGCLFMVPRPVTELYNIFQKPSLEPSRPGAVLVMRCSARCESLIEWMNE